MTASTIFTANPHDPLTAAWYEQRIASSVADYNAQEKAGTHIGELRGLAEGLVRRLAELEAVQPTKAQRETAETGAMR